MQRCDGKQPCTPCSKDGGSDCVYERGRAKQPVPKKQPTTVQTLPSSFKSKQSPHCSSPSRVNSEDPAPPTPDIASADTCHPAFSLVDRTLSSSSRNESHFLGSDTLDRFEPPVPREWTITTMKLLPFQEPPKCGQHTTRSIFSLLPSLHLHSIPRPLRMSLSLLSPEHFQVSDTTSSELDLSLCVFQFLRPHTRT